MPVLSHIISHRSFHGTSQSDIIFSILCTGKGEKSRSMNSQHATWKRNIDSIVMPRKSEV
ncbi:hypothetical protein BDZ91DRAFT_726622 [Kalaharituber pfeilii]|nr:hypothetical protein BDZ91DRAFT_726622 [Kalaharituber pfeilii]